ncbi:MAG: hypothetical protein H8E33_03185 [Candidatus Cloacimonetes bacterium]|nr:hypothetical protein [Candidatus Cloacimonadota bacterium]MBL7108124.1 hypothetical protein [Candidatus Cloacimonadota bacterium]
MKKVAWIFGIVGALMMLFGAIWFLGIFKFGIGQNGIYFFHIANSCFLFALLCKCWCHHHKGECKEK